MVHRSLRPGVWGFLVLALLPWSAACRADEIEIGRLEAARGLNADLMTLHDPSASWTVREVAGSLMADKFQRPAAPSSASQAFAGVRWLRVELRNELAAGGHWLLELDNLSEDDVSAFVSRRLRRHDGTTALEAQELVQEPGYGELVFRLDAAPFDRLTVYVRVPAAAAEELQLQLWPADEYRSAVLAEHLLMGGFYGSLLVMALYNLVLFGSLRDRTYLYFSLFLAALCLSAFNWDGYAAGYLWSETSTWHRLSFAMIDAITIAIGIQFARSYLDTSQSMPRIDVGLRQLRSLTMAVVPLSLVFAGQPDGFRAIEILTLISPVVLLGVGFVALTRGNRAARFYLIALTVLLLGITLEAAAGYAPGGMSGTLAWTELGFYVGSISMAVFSCLGLADRYHQQVRTRTQAEAKAQSLRMLSYKDGLTGIWNRRRLDEQLRQEWQRAAREGTVLSLVLIDIDFFKRYNDGYGHQAGDDCLRQVAQALQSTVSRPADMVARYGGEEFAALLPNVDARAARQVAEAMCRAVSTMRIPHGYSAASSFVTVSVGLADAAPHPDSEAADLIAEADRVLYRAKEQGRNQVCVVDRASAGVALTVEATVDEPLMPV